MTGYEFIKNMPDTEISATFGVGILAAVNIRNSTLDQMIRNTNVCPAGIEKIKMPCEYETSSCVKCRRGFLENEVSM